MEEESRDENFKLQQRLGNGDHCVLHICIDFRHAEIRRSTGATYRVHIQLVRIGNGQGSTPGLAL